MITFSPEQLDELAEKVMSKLIVKLSAREEFVDKRLNELQGGNDRLAAKTDDLEQRSRLENLRIFGLAEKSNENTDQLVLDVAKKVGVTLNLSSIARSHRVGKKRPGSSRPVIVKFVSFADRQRMFGAKKNLKGTKITIKEDLTNTRMEILKAAMNHFSDSSVWTQNGTIVIKSPGGQFHHIRTMTELENLTTE